MNNIRKLVRQVAEGQDPTAALTGESFNHTTPKLLEAFGSGDLEKMYGGDFDAHNNVRTFQPIDTGAGVRIRNITVRPNYRDEDAATLPHSRNSRVYVSTTDAHKTLAKAFGVAGGFLKGDTSAPTPVDTLSHEHGEGGGEELPTNVGDGRDALRGFLSGSSGPISDMMKLRLPENNPHQAWREGVLPHVFKHLGITGTGANDQPHAQWHKNAGCGTCPCSPGFILHKSNHPMAHNHDIHVEVD